MKQLVLKDIRIMGLTNVILILAALLVGSMGAYYESTFKSNAIYIVAVLIGTYLVVMTLTNKDILYNVQPLLISMPTRRFNIIVARYSTILFYMVFLIATVFLSSNISKLLFNNIKGPTFGLVPMIFAASLLLIFLSITIPIHYYDIKKAQIVNAIFYGFLVLFPNVYYKLGFDFINPGLLERLGSLNLKIITPVAFTLSLVIYLTSMLISRTIYEKKEF